MKKIAYIGKIQLSDVDLSLLHELQKRQDVTYLMEVTPRFMQGPAFNIRSMYPHSGIFKAIDAYPEFGKFAEFINLDKFYVVNTCGKLWQLKAFWTNLLLLFFLVRNKFDVIHWVWPPNIYEFCCYCQRRRMVLTVHDPFPHSGLDTFIVRLRRKVAFRLIPNLILLNKAQRQDFLDYYKIAPERVMISRLSSYTYLQTVKADERLLPKKRFALFLGKISQYKGLDYLLPAMEEVHKTHPDSMLVVAGAGEFHFDVARYMQLDYVDIRNRFIPDEELVGLLRNAAFVVCPYTDATQSGVIMSAFAFYKPVIATRVGALPEMLQDGLFGKLIPERDTTAIAESMQAWLENPQQVNTYKANIAAEYEHGTQSWRTIAEELTNKYETL